MAQLIPIATVRIIFRPTQVQTSVFEYFGTLIGSAKDLHDIETKGYFTPVAADTQLIDSDTGDAVVIDYSQATPLEILPREYPRYRANSEILPDTVKVYLKDLTYIQLFKAAAGGNKYRWLPGTAADFGTDGSFNGGQLVQEDTAGMPYTIENADFGMTVTTDANGKISLGMAVVSGSTPKKIEPGTTKIFIANADYPVAPLVFMDIPPVGGSKTAFNPASAGLDAAGAITGQLYPFIDDSVPANMWPGNSEPQPTIVSNTLRINYHTGVISGELIMDTLPAGTLGRLIKTGSAFKCYTLTVVYSNDAAVKALKNIGVGDWVVLDKSQMTVPVAGTIMTNATAAGSWASHADFTMAKIQENVKNGYGNYVYVPTTPTYTKVNGFNALTSVFQLNAATVHKTDMVGEDLDYRCHGGMSLVAVEANAYRRLEEGTSGQYEIETTGPIDIKGRITMVPSAMIIDTMVRDNAAHLYDDDPTDYTVLLPAMTVPNLITGAVYVEYENELQSAQILSKLLQFDVNTMNVNTAASYLGQYDPRNRLGFAAYMTSLIAPGRTFYVVPITWDGTGLSDALTMLTKNRTIMHVGLLNDTDTVIGTFDAWLKNEALPANSRFRFGYCSKTVETNVDKVQYPENGAGTLAFSLTGALSFTCTTGGWNYLTKNVAAGDTFEYKDLDGDASGFYTVSTFDNTHLYFEEILPKSKVFGNTGNEIHFTADTMPKEGTILGYAKVQSPSGVISLASISIGASAGDYDASIIVSGSPVVVAKFARSAGVPPTTLLLTVTGQSSYTIVGRPWAVYYPADVTLTQHAVYRTLNASERATLLASQQASDTNNIVKIVAGSGIQYTHIFDGVSYLDTLGIWFAPVCAFALKIGFPPHQPLTFVELSGFGLGAVLDMSEYDMTADLLKLAQNGYYCLYSEEGGAPYCLSDVTAAIKTKSELEGVLSKINPVFQYGNDAWLTVRPYLGKYNVVADLVNLVGLKLLSLKQKYTGTVYPLLGTLLATVGDPTITPIANGLSVVIPMSPQDPNREVNVTLEVTDKQA